MVHMAYAILVMDFMFFNLKDRDVAGVSSLHDV